MFGDTFQASDIHDHSGQILADCEFASKRAPLQSSAPGNSLAVRLFHHKPGSPIMDRFRSIVVVLGMFGIAAACATVVGILPAKVVAAEKMKALIVDGQNNHGIWPKTTKMMKK